MNNKIVLISFCNPKQIGVKYLQASLEENGFEVLVIALKKYNSKKPGRLTGTELRILEECITEFKPLFVGISVNTSFNLELVSIVAKMLDKLGITSLWGGVFPTIEPDKAFEFGAKLIIAGEGEDAIVEFAKALRSGSNISDVPNLIRKVDSKILSNPLLPLKKSVDDYGMPKPCSKNRILLDNDKIQPRDPNLDSYGYELSATRGCPFECSYCSSVCLKRMYNDKNFVRHRSVGHLLSELSEAKRQISKLRFVHFWDEIFPDKKEWIDEFSKRYRSEIGLPFEVWGHPLRINEYTIKKLVQAGLYEITVGIQSGSERVRREVFNRFESEKQILRSSEILSSCGVPNVVYDFMLRHPFETLDDIKETYTLCMKLKPPFSLQLHGLGFLPGTDICNKAVESGIYTKEQLESLMYGTADEVYNSFWGVSSDEERDFWYNLIYLTQFPAFRNKTKIYASNPEKYKAITQRSVKKARILEKIRYYYKKSKIFFRLCTPIKE